MDPSLCRQSYSCILYSVFTFFLTNFLQEVQLKNAGFVNVLLVQNILGITTVAETGNVLKVTLKKY